MQRKILLMGIIAILICLVLAGCGNKDVKTTGAEIEDNTSVKTDEGIEKDNKTDKTQTNADSTIEELYSDNSKIVYKNDDTYMVFYYTGEKITKYAAYEEYASEFVAEKALEAYNKDPDPDISKVYVKGRYLVAEFKDSEYTTFTVSELKQAFDYLQEMKK